MIRKYFYGNCLTYAIYDYIKNGGKFFIVIHNNNIIPHFVVERNNTVFDLAIVRMFLYVFLYKGQIRTTSCDVYYKMSRVYKEKLILLVKKRSIEK